MTSPRFRTGKGGTYVLPDGTQLYGVSSLAKGVETDPGGLIGWSAKLAIEAAIDTRLEWDPLANRDDAAKLIGKLARARRSVAADVGTDVHTAIERELASPGLVSWPVEVRPFKRALDDFLDEYSPTVLLVEATVVNLRLGYAGTLDTMLEIAGVGRVLVDWKTGSLRNSAAAQLMLLDRAQAQLLDDGTLVDYVGGDELWIVQIQTDGFTVTRVSDEARERADELALSLVEIRSFAELDLFEATT